jgi:hypothetical protein
MFPIASFQGLFSCFNETAVFWVEANGYGSVRHIAVNMRANVDFSLWNFLELFACRLAVMCNVRLLRLLICCMERLVLRLSLLIVFQLSRRLLLWACSSRTKFRITSRVSRRILPESLNFSIASSSYWLI